MQTHAVFAGPDELKGLYGKIQAWRQTRPGTRPMPEELWQEATSAARTLGIYRVVRALRLGSAGLKRRVMASTSARRAGARKAARLAGQLPARRADFIEMSGLCGLPSASPAAAAGDAVVEVEVAAPDGERLRIRLQVSIANVAALVHALRGRG